MEIINLTDIRDRNYFGVPKDIAKSIIDKGHSLQFSGFDTYSEIDENGKCILSFHYNDFELYRNGLLKK